MKVSLEERLRAASEEIMRGVSSPGHAALMRQAADALERYGAKDREDGGKPG